MELRCAIQPYAWGKIGRSSEVALLQESADPQFQVQAEEPYAELWMGAHPSAPSVVKGSNEKLSDFIKSNPEVLGQAVQNKFGNELPFLFKVLSVNKALSIQAHPNKEHAKKLHSERPDLYKDPNHKPELAIALTPFEALCGFRPIHQIKDFLNCVPELATVVGESASALQNSDEAGLHGALRLCFKALMTCPKDTVQKQLSNLLQRHSTLDESSRSVELANLVSRLASEFPGDVGCFCVYFLNQLTLSPGEALYLGPNEPHAYLAGDCIECMACSDNVVRAGLTPKYMDVETLCSMLTYSCDEADTKRFQPTVLDPYTQLFAPPVPDFAVAKIEVPPGERCCDIGARNSASILLVTRGQANTEGMAVKRGTVLFLPAGRSMTLTMTGSTEPLLAFQAMANV